MAPKTAVTPNDNPGSDAPQKGGATEAEQANHNPAMRVRQAKPVSQPDGTVAYEPVEQPEGPQVRYVGLASRRVLTPEDWERVGVDDTEHKTYVWDIKNAMMIPLSEFSAKQIEYLKLDDRFVVDFEG